MSGGGEGRRGRIFSRGPAERQTELYRTRVNTAEDFQNAQDAFAAANAELASAEARLELAKLNLGYTKVLAPVAGYVTKVLSQNKCINISSE